MDGGATRESAPVIQQHNRQTIGTYVDEYALTHPLGADTLRQYRITAKLFETWAGREVALDELDSRMVSEFVAAYGKQVSPRTVRSKRSQILALWRAAADDDLCDPPLKRVRPVRCPMIAPTAWTREEIQTLTATCARLPRWHRCGLRRAEWWQLAIRISWDTGLRWEDQMFRLRCDMISPDGCMAFVQHKTGRVMVARLADSTLAALRGSLERCPRELVTPWMGSHETFADQMRALVRKAGIRKGTWKWIRRAGATDVECREPGGASRHLGHAPGSRLAYSAYVDPTILAASRRMVAPQPLD
jgi:integrase